MHKWQVYQSLTPLYYLFSEHVFFIASISSLKLRKQLGMIWSGPVSRNFTDFCGSKQPA
jgi:hypothetical protein